MSQDKEPHPDQTTGQTEDKSQYVQDWMSRQTEDEQGPDISVVVPAYNEEWRLPPTLVDMIDYFDSGDGTYEIIVVDDGSRDNTVGIVEKFARLRTQIRLIRLPKNYGKGHAVRTGVLNARGERVLFADADGSTPIKEVERLHSAIDDGADIAFGSRALQSEETSIKTVWYRKLLGRTFNLVVNMFLLPGIKDTQCGFKLMKTPVAKQIFSKMTADGFSFDLELLFLARRLNAEASEVAINWVNVPGSKVNLVVDVPAD